MLIRKNLLIVELGLHHIRLLVWQSVSNMKLPAGGRSACNDCVAYLITIFIHLINVAYVVRLE
jgi:hypothetical protein